MRVDLPLFSELVAFATQANLSLLNGRFSFDSTVNMRPYKWAQRIAGIDLVVDKGPTSCPWRRAMTRTVP